MPLNDDDLIIVGRPDPDPNEEPETLKMTWAQLKEEINALIDAKIP